MTVLKNSYLLLVAGLLALLSCDNKTHNNRSEEGYLKSAAYHRYLEDYKDDKQNIDYSTKRMFMLLGEESFSYSSEYDFYVIFCYFYKTRDTVDFFVVKSIDNIMSVTKKRLCDYNSKSFFYYNKVSGSGLDSNIIDFAVKTKVIGEEKSDYVISLFEKATSSLQPEGTYFPPYHAPIRGFYLINGKNYYLVNESNLNPVTMNEIDSFFRKSELFGTE